MRSGRFGAHAAESFADAMDPATREPATKADFDELRSEFVLLNQRFDILEKGLDARFVAQSDRLMIRLGGLGLALAGLLFAALRLT